MNSNNYRNVYDNRNEYLQSPNTKGKSYDLNGWIKNPISIISVVLIVFLFVCSASLSIILLARNSKDHVELAEVSSATNLIVDGKFTLNKDQLIEQINALPDVSFTCNKSLVDDKAYYSGDIQDGIDLTIVCEPDKTTVSGLILVAKNEYAHEGGAFLGSLFHILFPNNYNEKINEFLDKSELSELRYGDTHCCYIDNVFFTVKMTSEETTTVIMPKSEK